MELVAAALVSRNGNFVFVELEDKVVALLVNGRVDEVHLRRSDEACYEHVAGIIIEVLRGVNLLDNAVLHNDDPGTERHSLGLVMGYIDEGGAQSLIDLGDLGTHLCTELCIQVGQRLVEKEYAGITNDGTTHGNTLSLTTGQSLRLSLEELLDTEDPGSLNNSSVDLVLGHLSELQTKRHVIINGHMRIQSIVLEYHCDISVLGSNVIYEGVADVQLALGNILEACNHSQGCGLTAAGRTYEDDKLFVSDFKVEILNGGYIAVINFVHVS